MSKTSDRIVLIIGLLGVFLLTGCGVTSTSLPSNLQAAGGGPLSIITTTFPDAITGRSYFLVLSTTGGSGILSSCTVVSGSLPPTVTGGTTPSLSWSVSANTCILSGTSVGPPGTYSVVVQATDTSSPPKTDQLPYTLTVRNDYSVCASPSSALPLPYTTSCTATSAAATVTSFPDAVQGRSYGVSPLSQEVVTNLNLTADTSPVGHTTEFGNGPFTATSAITGLAPGITYTATPSLSSFVLNSTAVGAANTYTVTVSVTDNPISASQTPPTVVPARTVTKTYTLIVHPPLQLAQSLTANWPDAVSGRPYGTGSGCTGAAGCAPAVYTASGGLSGAGLTGYVWPTTTPASISAITGMTCPAVAVGNATYTCSAAKITAPPTTAGAAAVSYSPSVTITDTANAATPAATTTTDPLSTRTDTLFVDAPLLATLNQTGDTPVTNPGSLIPGVSGRSYGGTGYSTPTYTATGGLGSRNVADYEWCVDTETASLPAGLGGITVGGTSTPCSTFGPIGAVTATLSATDITATITPPSQNFSFTVELDDTGNASTPTSVGATLATSTSATNSTSLVINAPLMATLTQNGTTIASGGALLPGVFNRTYGAASSGAPTFTAAGGLGLSTLGKGPYGWCISAGALPPGFLSTGTNLNTPCTSSEDMENAATLAANPITLLSPPSTSAITYSFTVRLDDGGNLAVPSGATSGTTNAVSTSITVNPQLALTTNLGPSWPDAVQGRAYGQGTGCSGAAPGNCSPMIYTAAGGLGAVGGYRFPTASGFPTPISCITASPTLTCSGGAITQATGATHPMVTGLDVANAATPVATTTTDPGSTQTDTLNVDAPLALAVDAASIDPPQNGVQGRTYGNTAAGFTALVYDASGGLGPFASPPGTYSFTGVTPISSPGTGVPAGVACTPSATQITCSSGASTVTAAPGAYILTTTLNDTPNATTPSGSGSTPVTTVALPNKTITINVPLALASDANSADLGTTPPNAVQLRSYGNTGAMCGTVACKALIYDAAGGLGPSASPAGTYSFTSVSSIASPGTGVPAAVACTAGATAMTCGSSGTSTVTAATGSYTFSTTLNDTANAMTPSGSGSSTTFALPNKTITVNAPLALAVDAASVDPPQNGVQNRPYGNTGATCGTAACEALIYDASGGLGPAASPAGTYSFTAISSIASPGTGVPAAVACTAGATAMTCGSSGASTVTAATGTYTFSTTLNDTANAATPSGSGSSTTFALPNKTITINAPLALAVDAASVDPPQNGVQGRSYGNTGAGFKALVYDASGGLGPSASPAGTYSFSGVSAISSPGTGVPAGVACTPSSTQITCSSGTSTVSANPGNYTFATTLNDTANATTPSGSGTTPATTVTLPTKTITVNAPLALASDASSADFGTPPPNGVQGRSYGNTGAGFKALIYDASGGLGPSASPAGTYSLTAISSITAPGTGVPAAVACTAGATAMTCGSSGSSTVTAATGNYTFSTTLNDTANAMTPSGSGSSTTFALPTKTLTVNAPLALASDANSADAGTTPPNGVQGRSYGNTGAGFKALIYDASGGLGPSATPAGTYSLTAISSIASPGTGVPSAVACAATPAANPTAMTCGSSGTSTVTAATGSYTFSTTLNDTANAATPSGSGSSTTFALPNKTITINAPLALAVDGASVDPPPSGVQGRSYGNTGAGFKALIYDASGGLGPSASPAGSYSFTGISAIGSAGTGVPTGVTCTPGSTQITCTSGASTVSANPGSYTFATTLNDTANAATPSGSGSSTTVTLPTKTLTINAPLALASDPSSADSGGTVPPGVQGRSYGNTSATCGTVACEALIYDATGGLGPSGYSFTSVPSIASPGTGVPAAVTCSVGATAMTCTSTTSTVTAATGNYTFSTTLNDTANATTPSGSGSSPVTTFALPNKTIAINGPLALAVDATLSASPTTPTAPDAVQGRTYGVNGGGANGSCAGPAACKSLVFDATNGLGGYKFPSFTALTSPGSGLPSGIGCSQLGGAGTSPFTCSSGGSIVPNTTGTGSYSFSVTLDDTANVATQSASSSSSQPTAIASSIKVDPPLALTVDATSPDPPPAGVVGRQYGDTSLSTCVVSGSPANCEALIYDAGGGLGTYTFTDPSSISSPGTGVPAAVACSHSGNLKETCTSGSSASSVITASNGIYNFTVAVDDGGNAATPDDSTSSKTGNISKSVTIDNPLTLGVSPSSPFPDGVAGRDYAVKTDTCLGVSCTTLSYTATNGLANGYTITPNTGTYPTGFTFPCTASTVSVTNDTLSCFAQPLNTSVAGSYTPKVAATDTANASTPAALPSTDPGSSRTDALTVDPEIVIQNAALETPTCGTATTTLPSCPLPNGQITEPYSVLFTCQAPLNSTGTCGGTGNPGNANAEYTWTATAGGSNNVTGLSFTSSLPAYQMPVAQPTGDAIFSGTPTFTGTPPPPFPGASETFTIGVTDNGNSTTPSYTVANSGPLKATFSANILPSQAYVGSTNTKAVAVIDTSQGESALTASSFSTTGGLSPLYVAASSNGSYMFIADDGSHQLDMINTLSPSSITQVTNSQGLDTGADDTYAVAVGPQAVSGSPNSLSSPDDVYAYIGNYSSGNVQVVNANPSSTNFGNGTTPVGNISFTGTVGVRDLKVAPTFNIGTSASPVRLTHGYVLTGKPDVCVFDAEPSDVPPLVTPATFLTQIPAAHGADSDGCIPLPSGFTVENIDVSPDGLYAFVAGGVASPGPPPTVTDQLVVIDTNPNDTSTFETVINTLTVSSCSGELEGVRVTPDGQTVWAACSVSMELVPFETASVGSAQFSQLTALPTSLDEPDLLAFRPDDAFGLTTAPSQNLVLPFTLTATGTAVDTNTLTPSLTEPTGIDHIPNPALHITTSALYPATHGEAYQSSVVAAGPNRYYTFADVTPASVGPTLAELGLSLNPDGEVTGSPCTGTFTCSSPPGTFSFTIQVTDQAQPVNNLVVQTVTLVVN